MATITGQKLDKKSPECCFRGRTNKLNENMWNINKAYELAQNMFPSLSTQAKEMSLQTIGIYNVSKK